MRTFISALLFGLAFSISIGASEYVTPVHINTLAGQAVEGDARALSQLLSVAEEGDAHAQLMLGSMYEIGQGVTQDYAQAVKLYREAAEQGDADAQASLGVMCAIGQGVTQDYAQALKWLLIAKAEGARRINQIVSQIEGKATPAQVAHAQDMARRWWAAHHPQH